MKVIQICAIPSTESAYGRLYALTDDGRLFQDIRDGEGNGWVVIDPPEDPTTESLAYRINAMPVKEQRAALDLLLGELGMVARGYLREHFADEIARDEDVRRTDQLAARIEI